MANVTTHYERTGIVIFCDTCGEQTTHRMATKRDAEEYGRWEEAGVRAFAESHPCIEAGRRIFIESFGPGNKRQTPDDCHAARAIKEATGATG